MNRRRYAIAVASLLLLATGAGCANHETPAATDVSAGSSTPVGSSSSAAVTTPLEGKWRASISLAAAKSTLRAAGLGKLIPRVVTCPACLPSPDFELRIVGDQWLLFNGGEVIDDGGITIDRDQVIIEAPEVPGKSILGFKVDRNRLKLSFVRQTRPKVAPGLTEEPIIRMLYTTAPWTRVS